MGIRVKSRSVIVATLCLSILSALLGTLFFSSTSAAGVDKLWLFLTVLVSSLPTVIVLLFTVSRMRQLGSDVSAVARGGDLSFRIRNFNLGELDELSANINAMLKALEESQEHLVVARDAAEASDRAKSSLIEQLKRRDMELVQARNIAEQASRAKSDFLANTSHEIRTPINNIIGFSEMLAESVSEPNARRQIELIKVSADSLLKLINDILDLSKVEANKLELRPEVCNLREFLSNLVAPFIAAAESKGISLILHLGDTLPQLVMVDPARLGQVLMNLINNAIKFSEMGGQIFVNVTAANLSARSGRIRFQVKDTGIGISPSAQRKIFNSFEQADTSLTRLYGGTGLGLSISQRIASMLGGAISVESELGKGATFLLELDLPIVEDPQYSSPTIQKQTSARDAGKDSLRVLVVEDNPLSREIAVHRLKKNGFLVVVAESGERAVELARDQSFDLILMDCQMPNMDGFQATAHIRREQEVRNARCPIIALTAHAMEGYREQCLNAGMDDFITKPIKDAELQEFLRRFQQSRDEAKEDKL